ncbi:anthranilate phosphoribosyltransferase [Lactiplantibacillus argentoratensis]|jgi:anthranilate phosphoribosyltransferase|uniref:anthranilate phosphoribosyltransferase n=1 Tax=Lactiplantibacillus argentoratensis TaxID=271881 RepID=UPI0006C684DF|nr:anthranilate phosphoribosyltransferase [Lactiplantibacillus argentoratensis]KON39485.1 anthranilate phosphoribosyltransferase [Lactiplantibacillus plantarum]KTF01304.1 Anthranilate phosphoribosyltransferase [Lactiplantibacillus plantarum]KZT79952.1 Anthranilate phosphoribosyltransferase [Lactiplantibacillus plantarum]MBU5277340.1 anthranilate phosphoribosyltransferase [Lactiplantibacillus argentoratensis]MCB7461873.1 anthranilate phosphoribosyltransferase [Lactiplantibacillus argentoratensi
MIETAIAQLTNQENLDFTMSQQVITEIMKGQATDAQIGSFLTALAIKKATIDEIAGAATAMRSQALPFKVKRPTLEIVGTGGDRSNSFNISTTTALVVAAAGVPVTKHGNRAASSKSGAADVLEALGIKIDLTPAQSLALLERTNFAFMYAREYHQAMRFVAPARQQIKIPTIFNILGPLANPAHAEMQLLGVYRQALMAPLAEVLTRLGVKHAMVVHSRDGLDEISAAAPTDVIVINHGQQVTRILTPEQFGLTRCDHAALIGDSAQVNAAITRAVLAGEPGAPRDVVLMNAAAALHIAKPQLDLAAAFELAQQTIDQGAAAAKLAQLIQSSQAVMAS